MLDSLIYTGIVLLVLSQITEKITTFIRSYVKVISNSGRNFWKKEKIFFGKLINRLLSALLVLDNVSDLEKSRIREVSGDEKSQVEFAITKLSILIGFAIALSFKANLFELLDAKGYPHEYLGWKGYQFCFSEWQCWGFFIKTMAGCLATGFLLTFGSKFFHDLLEMLYEVKRLRRKLADEQVYRSPDMETLLQRVQSKTDDPVKLVLNRHKSKLLRLFPNLVFIARAFDDHGNSYLELRVSDDQLDAIKKYEFDYLENGELKKLPVSSIDFIPNVGFAEPLAGNRLFVGGFIFNDADIDNKGTLGFFTTRQTDQVPVFVTCYHVLRTELHGWSELGDVDPDLNHVLGKLEGKTSFTHIGILEKGAITDLLDVAVVRLDPEILPQNEDLELGPFNIANFHSIQPGASIKVNGATSPKKDGLIHSTNNSVRINYSLPRELKDLIAIKNVESSTIPIAQKGDSGAVVVDSENNAIGMVVAILDNLTLAIPIHRLLNFINDTTQQTNSES